MSMNQELRETIKLQEFDYVGKSGEMVKQYSMKPVEEILALLKDKQ